MILDLLFPKRCVSCGKFGNYLCQKCTKLLETVEFPVCPNCQRQAVGGRVHPRCFKKFGLDGLVIGCRYRGPVRKLVTKLKYKWIFDLQDVLVQIMIANLWRYDLPKNLVLVPVPLYPSRKRWRGFNQAELFAKRLSARFGVTWANVLVRSRETRPQVNLKRQNRILNVRDAFSVNDAFKNKVSGRRFLLIDDVYTTGSTMAECAKVLKKAGAREVWGMVAALG